MLKVGDSVSVIHDRISGKILSVSGPKVTLEDTDGFIRHFKSHELAIISSNNYKIDSSEASQFIEKETEVVLIKSQPKQNVTNPENEVSANANEIDLHIEVLYPEAVHWTVADILQKQMIACRAFIEKSVANKKKKVVIIHGKGEGVLKSEIYRYLGRAQDYLHLSISYHDADFRQFGTGATQVNFDY